MRPYQVAKLFGQAYLQAATMLTAINGFRKCGIWPLDRYVFTDADFIAAETTNTEALPSENIDDNATSQVPTASTSTPLDTTQTEITISEVTIDEPFITVLADASSDRTPTEIISTEVLSQPSTSAYLIKEKTPDRQIQPAKSSFIVTPTNIIAIPKEVRTQERKTRKRGKTAILTASPYKNDLIKNINKRQKGNKTTEKEKPKHKKIEKEKPEKKKTGKNNKTKRRRTNKSDTDNNSSENDKNDCPCIYCGYLYSQSTEGWVVCGVCHSWAHNSCAGVDDEDDEAHICDHCKPN